MGARALVGSEDEDDAGPLDFLDFTYPSYDPGTGPGQGYGRNGRFSNVFVNDPCLDPPPPSIARTVQSETEIAVLNKVPGQKNDGRDGDNGNGGGRLMVAGFNDSWGFYNNRQGLSGFAYSINGGRSWIDGGGLPPLVPTGFPNVVIPGFPVPPPGQDGYFGDPVVQVHHRSKTFYYASIYKLPDGTFSLAVNRGHFQVAPPQNAVEPESKSNTRCAGHPERFGTPDPATNSERIIWEPPVVAVPVVDPNDFLDKEWLYVDQRTGELYLVYVRFGSDGSTPLELVRSFDGGHTWTSPSVILPNQPGFNTGLSVVTTRTGRVIASWFARVASATTGAEIAQQIQVAYSDNDGVTFSLPIVVTGVNPQGEPKGYNRRRATILNVTYLAADKGDYDGAVGRGGGDNGDGHRRNHGNVYVSYFDGKTPLGAVTKAADTKLSVSTDGGETWSSPVKVNSDNTNTTHVFPSVQVNNRGTVFVTWIDRRVDPVNNILNDTWGAFSNNGGRSFGRNIRITNVSTDWFVRADARPNMGDYNSSEVINFTDFASIWADGRFPEGTFVPPTCTPAPPAGQPCPPRRAATPDVLLQVVGDGSGSGDDGSGR